MRIATKPVSRKNFFCAAAIAALAVTGCADVPDAAQNEGAEQTEVKEVSSTEQALANTSGVTFSEVVANGTGCPKGTYTASISPDGQVFTMTFSQYEVNFNKSNAGGIKDCLITVRLKTPNGISYAVSDFHYSGYAVVPSGSSVKLMAAYTYQGFSTVANDKSKKTITGPYDDGYTFTDSVLTENLNWSPCGAVRDLNIRTNFSVNNSGKGDGYMSLAALDGSMKEGKLIVKFNTKKCN